VTFASASPAALPPSGLPGLDPKWSRLIATPGLDTGRTWHVLDNQVGNPRLTLLCVHGNPTWSYLWRDLIVSAPDDVRVIAIDHLDMGFSERTGTTRRLKQRIDDLSALTDEIGLTGPVVTVGHDWGGPISLGWAQRNREQIAGIVLMNTAVHQPKGSRAPSLIRMVRVRGVLKGVCETSPTFIRGTMALARPRLRKSIRDAYEAPYRNPGRRSAIATFVEDIPLSEDHPSHQTLEEIAADLEQFAEVPALLLWGPSDPVFSDLYLRDLAGRLPTAVIHRFIGSGHLLPEDADIASAVFPWVDQLENPAKLAPPIEEREPLWAALDRRASDDDVAIVEMGPEGEKVSITFAELQSVVVRTSAGLVDLGVVKGDRIALMVPPGIDLAVCVFAAWRIGAVVVLADAGLGIPGMGRAMASANPAYLIGIPKALAAARTLGWPGIRISTTKLPPTRTRLLRVAATLDEIRSRGEGQQKPPTPMSTDIAAIGFTSGATGPAKGVVYLHHQLEAQRDAIVDLYRIGLSDSLVAAFGPFALAGTLMGLPSAVPDMKVTSPASLTARALSDAVHAVKATLVFASPAALKNITATAGGIPTDQVTDMDGVRLLMSAGAPVPALVLRAAVKLMPNAEAHTPYGMTEVMPVADIDLGEIEDAGMGDGVCVGSPVPDVEVAISALDPNGEPTGALTIDHGVVGEVCIRTPHMRHGYDKLWVTSHTASQPEGWHRSGDVGHIDADGRLWIQGRIGHVVTTASGPVTPVGIEHAVGTLPDVALVAVIGVGPRGAQQVVVVIVPTSGAGRPGVADEELADRVRAEAGDVDVAAVLRVPSLPVDKRHNSKIDRTRIARWAERVLSGGRMGRI